MLPPTSLTWPAISCVALGYLSNRTASYLYQSYPRYRLSHKKGFCEKGTTMPPNASSAKKGSAGIKEGDELPLSAVEEAKMFEATCQSLQIQLAERTEEVGRVTEEKRKLEAKVTMLQQDFHEEHKAAFEITRDMTRQYKGMQEQLVDRITQLSRTVQELQDQLEQAEQHLDSIVKEKERIIELKDDEINQMKVRMEGMAQEFGGMLKETLDKMRQRIEISSGTVDMERGVLDLPHISS